MQAMVTLLLGGTLPDEADLIVPVGAEHPMMWCLIMLFILLAGLSPLPFTQPTRAHGGPQGPGAQGPSGPYIYIYIYIYMQEPSVTVCHFCDV